jgi:PAS domain-containing protein
MLTRRTESASTAGTPRGGAPPRGQTGPRHSGRIEGRTEDRSRCEEAFSKLRNTPGLSLDLEHRFRHKDGTWRWAEGTFESLFDDPEIGGLVATVRDVTEKKRAEEALREEKYRTLVEDVGAHAVFLLDKEGVVTEWTARASWRTTGKTSTQGRRRRRRGGWG